MLRLSVLKDTVLHYLELCNSPLQLVKMLLPASEGNG